MHRKLSCGAKIWKFPSSVDALQSNHRASHNPCCFFGRDRILVLSEVQPEGWRTSCKKAKSRGGIYIYHINYSITLIDYSITLIDYSITVIFPPPAPKVGRQTTHPPASAPTPTTQKHLTHKYVKCSAEQPTRSIAATPPHRRPELATASLPASCKFGPPHRRPEVRRSFFLTCHFPVTSWQQVRLQKNFLF